MVRAMTGLFINLLVVALLSLLAVLAVGAIGGSEDTRATEKGANPLTSLVRFDSFHTIPAMLKAPRRR